jgi:hypothetical protein
MRRVPERSSERRALAMLSDNADGCTEAILLAHGFAPKLIDDLVGAGFATAKAGHMLTGRRGVDVTRIRITDAGRRALAAGP